MSDYPSFLGCHLKVKFLHSKTEGCGVSSLLFCFVSLYRQELIEATVLCLEEAFLEKGMISFLNFTIKFGHFCQSNSLVIEWQSPIDKIRPFRQIYNGLWCPCSLRCLLVCFSAEIDWFRKTAHFVAVAKEWVSLAQDIIFFKAVLYLKSALLKCRFIT